MPPSSEAGESSSSVRGANLTDDEVDRYRTLKQRLNAAEKKQAKDLWEIKSEDLYLVEYDTFKEFAEHEVGCSRRQADRLANWGRILSVVSSGGPTCEAQARPLSSIEGADDVRQIWKRARELADDRGSSMTAALVRKARGNVLAEKSGNGSGDALDGNAGNDTKTTLAPSDNDDESKSSTETRTSDATDKSPDQERDLEGAETDNYSSGQDAAPDEGNSKERTEDPEDASTTRSSTPLTDLKMSVAVPEAVASRHGVEHLAEGRDQQRDFQVPLDDLGLEKLQTLVQEMSPERAPPLAKSIPVADGFTFPLKGPDEPRKTILHPDEALGIPDTLRLRTLVQLQRKTGRDATCKILFSPGLDLFAPPVPGELQQVVLDACRGIEPTVLLSTDHPNRVPGLKVPESVWIGSRTSFSALGETESGLQEANLSSAWIRLHIGGGDLQTSLPLSEDSPVDWLVCDSPHEAVAKKEYDELQQSAYDAGAELFFLDPVSVVHRAQPKLGQEAHPAD